MNIKNYIRLFLGVLFCCQLVEANTVSATSIANQLWKKGNVAFQEYEHESSLIYLNQALTIFEEEEQWSEYVLVLCKIAENLDKLERFEEMKQMSEQAVEVGCKYLEEDERALGQAYHLLGESYWVEGIFNNISSEEKEALLRQGIDYFEVAEEIFRGGKYWENLIENHLNMGFIRVHLRKDLEKAEVYLQEVIEMAQNEFSQKDSLRNVTFSYAYGSLSKIQRRFIGDYDKALEYANLSLRHRLLLPNKLQKDKWWLANKYFKIGELYTKKRDADLAEGFYKKAEELLEGLPPNELTYRVYHARNFLYNLELRYECKNIDYDQILDYHHKARKVVESVDFVSKSKQEKAKLEVYSWLAMIYFRKKNLNQATYWMSKVQEQLNKDLKEKAPDFLFFVNLEKANYQKDEGQLDGALSTLQTCLKQSVLIGENNCFHLTYSFMGQVYLKKKDYRLALNCFQKALTALFNKEFSIKDLGENQDIKNTALNIDLLRTLSYKAKTLYQYYLSNKDSMFLQNAFETYVGCIEITEVLDEKHLSDKSQEILSENTFILYEEAIEVALRLYELTNDVYYERQAFLFSEKSKAGILIEAINEGEIKANYLPDSLLQIEKRLKMNLAFYEQLIYVEKERQQQNESKIKIWEEKIFQLKRDKKLFLQNLENTHPYYFELKYASKITDETTIKKMLAENQALVEFFFGEENLYAFLILPDQKGRISNMETYRIEGGAKLKTQVSKLIDDHQNINCSFNEYVNNSHKIYQKLLGSIASQLNQNITDLIIVPDGILGYLPFEALITELPENKFKPNYSIHNLDYLIEDFQVGYTYSASLSLQHKNLLDSPNTFFQGEKTLLAYAPSFNGAYDGLLVRSCTDTLAELQCAKMEVQNLQNKWNGKVLVGKRASKEHFLKEALQSDILHLATHACIDDNNPNFNRIYFANKEYLTSLELYTLQLKSQLTVLSACNTGNGQLLKGEGIMSLARGFMAAGCSSLITTLWGVNDCTTKSLITHFYEHLYNGEQKNEALRNAKLTYLNDSETTRLSSHPFYWAAFVQLGDNRAIFRKESSNQLFGLYGVGAFFLLLGIIGILKRRFFKS